MRNNLLKKIAGNRGFTILEVLIAAMITGIITAAAFSFYVRMHAQSETQYDIAETQHLCRASLHDIKKNLRMAGYKLPAGHEPFEVNGDSLIIYRQGDTANSIDTTTYYLVEYNESEYFRMSNLPDGRQIFYLMKNIASGPSKNETQVFADYITGIRFAQNTPSSVWVQIGAQTMKEDMSKDKSDYTTASDYHVYTLDEMIKIRNVTS